MEQCFLALLVFFGYNFSYHPVPRSRDSNPRQTVELHLQRMPYRLCYKAAAAKKKLNLLVAILEHSFEKAEQLTHRLVVVSEPLIIPLLSERHLDAVLLLENRVRISMIDPNLL